MSGRIAGGAWTSADHFIRVLFTKLIYPGINRGLQLIREDFPMKNTDFAQFTAFQGQQRLVTGSLPEVALAVKRAAAGGSLSPILMIDDSTGQVIDLDLRGTESEILMRLPQATGSSTEPAADMPLPDSPAGEPRGRGRPKLGVMAREVTLLPRHWEWLGAQPGGASVALRKLVEEARRANGERDRTRAARNAAYHFMSAMAGNLPGFEDAARALFADDRRRFVGLIAGWPEDIRDHAVKLAFADRAAPPPA